MGAAFGAVWARPRVPGDRRPHPKEGPHLGEPPPPAPQTQAQTPRASALTGPMLMHLVKRSSAAMCSCSFWVARCRRLVLWWRSYKLRMAAGRGRGVVNGSRREERWLYHSRQPRPPPACLGNCVLALHAPPQHPAVNERTCAGGTSRRAGGGEQTGVWAQGGGGGTSGRGGEQRSEGEHSACSHSTTRRRPALSGQKDPWEPGLDWPLGTAPSVPQRRHPRPLKALGSESSVQEPESQAGLLDMSCARPAPVVPTGPQYRMVRRAEGDPLRGSVPSYDFRCPPTPGAQPARGGGAGGIPTVHEVEQPAVRRVQIVRGHAVPVCGPIDAAVVLHVELLRACGASAQTCWALGPGPLPPSPLRPGQTLRSTASPSPPQGASRLT